MTMTLENTSGLILACWVGKHTDQLLDELLRSTEGKTACKQWNSDNWGDDERVFPIEIEHYIGMDRTQRLERTNDIIRQQTGRWHRRKNKFSKLWEQTKVSTRLVMSYFKWIWTHSRLKTTAAQRTRLPTQPWLWKDIVAIPQLFSARPHSPNSYVYLPHQTDRQSQSLVGLTGANMRVLSPQSFYS